MDYISKRNWQELLYLATFKLFFRSLQCESSWLSPNFPELLKFYEEQFCIIRYVKSGPQGASRVSFELRIVWTWGTRPYKFILAKLSKMKTQIFTAYWNFLGFPLYNILKNEKVFAFVCCNFSVCNKTTVKHAFLQ
jgi:hypothetical protein